MKMKRIFGILLTLTMILGLMPGTSLTALAYDNNPYASLVNTTKTVKFNNIDWYIIADNSTAVNAGTVTLLAKDPIGASPFDLVSNNAYSASMVKNGLEGLIISGFFAGVADAIETIRVRGSSTDSEVEAKLWLLSWGEANAIYGKNKQVLKCSKADGAEANYWWLRSPGQSNNVMIVNGDNGEVIGYGNSPNKTFGVRPALKLDLSKVKFSSNVTITADKNMTKTEASGAASQTVVSGAIAITDVVYTANDGYYFPRDYSVDAVNGIRVTRNSYTQITVSGTPTDDASITLKAPTAKTTPDAPTTAAAVDCTTSANNDGMLTGVTPAMEYKKSDATDWTSGTLIAITGLVPGTYYVRFKATDTTYASGNQELTIAGYVPSYKVTYKVVNGMWSDGSTDDMVVFVQSGSNPANVPTGMKASSGYTGGAWDTDPTNATITGDTTFTYSFTAKQAAAVTKAPGPKTLTYNGQAQELVTAGEADGGTMQYALGSDATTAPTTGWSTSIPTKTDAGTYYVWYKVKGDANHEDSTASEPVTVTISPVNKDALNAAISAAEAYYDEIKGNADYAAIAETLKQAIDVAKAVAGNDNATEEQVNATVSSVTEAVKTAKADKEAAESIDIANCNISVKNQTYTGKALKPAVTVKYGKATLKKGTDYTVSYKNNTKIGRATVTVKGKGRYTGSRKLTFKISPKGTRFTTAKGGKQQIVLKWKNPKNVTGYVLQCSQKKNFSSKRTAIIRKAGTLSRTIRRVKANKTYYVRIRTYTKVNKKVYCSAWSEVVAIRTKAGGESNVPDGQAVEATIEATAEGEDMTLILDGELDEALLSEDIVVLPEALPEEDIPLTLAD